jgi:hypothetical protein
MHPTLDEVTVEDHGVHRHPIQRFDGGREAFLGPV